MKQKELEEKDRREVELEFSGRIHISFAWHTTQRLVQPTTTVGTQGFGPYTCSLPLLSWGEVCYLRHLYQSTDLANPQHSGIRHCSGIVCRTWFFSQYLVVMLARPIDRVTHSMGKLVTLTFLP